MLADASLPAGLAPFLRSAEVREEDSGEVSVALAPGPGLERLRSPVTRDRIAGELARHLGERRAIILRDDAPAAEEEPPGREDPGAKGRLSELIEREPLIAQAVEELDLKLFE